MQRVEESGALAPLRHFADPGRDYKARHRVSGAVQSACGSKWMHKALFLIKNAKYRVFLSWQGTGVTIGERQ
jgi:hypothetical protein